MKNTKYKIYEEHGFMRRPFIEMALKEPDSCIELIRGVKHHIIKNIILLDETTVLDVTFEIHKIGSCGECSK